MPVVLARLALATTGALAIAIVAVGCGGGEDPNPAVDPDPRFGAQPNFVFVLTDDQDFASYNRRTMPRTWRLLGQEGFSFDNTHDTTPLCCPSRAAYLTGQYGHNNGVLNNKPGYDDLDDKDNTLPVWLQRAGYETALVGKYLNGYERYVSDKDEVPPGWDRWSMLVGNARGYYDFQLTVDGKQRKETYQGEYMTDVLNDRAGELIGELSGDTPFFLQVAQSAPHNENINADSGGPCGGGAVPARRDERRFDGAALPNRPAVRERDVSDKPPFVAALGGFDPAKQEKIRSTYECRLETLPAVDRGVAEIVDKLRETGELDQTIIVFASDNGNFHGQHGLGSGKGLAYEEASHVPLVMRVPEAFRGPASRPGTRFEQPTANIDLAATMVEWSGTEPCPEAGDCRVLDGRSLMPLLTGPGAEWPDPRPIGIEFDIGKDQIQPGRPTSCHYQGVREGDWVYIEHTRVPNAEGVCEESDLVELYDRNADPFELDNLVATDPGAPHVVAQTERLAQLTAELATCSGIEGRDPEPESGNFCR
jgi:N-acetylglucosamine-6-sulfatase